MYESLKVEVTEMDYQTFLDISVRLTGFNKNELLATGMPETYYYAIMKEADQDNVRAFFKEAQKIMNEYGDNETNLNGQICHQLIPSAKYYELAKRIILLWYTGIWTSIVITNGKPISSSNMISSQSYSEGLIWVAAETHPAGAKQPGYASWSLPPL
jgi:hypothetical protein